MTWKNITKRLAASVMAFAMAAPCIFGAGFSVYAANSDTVNVKFCLSDFGQLKVKSDSGAITMDTFGVVDGDCDYSYPDEDEMRGVIVKAKKGTVLETTVLPDEGFVVRTYDGYDTKKSDAKYTVVADTDKTVTVSYGLKPIKENLTEEEEVAIEKELEELKASITFSDEAPAVGSKVGHATGMKVQAIGKDSDAVPMTSDGETITVTIDSGSLSYGGWGTHQFGVTTSTGKSVGFCMQPEASSPSGSSTARKLKTGDLGTIVVSGRPDITGSPNGITADAVEVMKALYAMWLDETSRNQFFNNDGKGGVAYCHAAISYVYSRSLKGLSASMATGVLRMVHYACAYAVERHIVDGRETLNLDKYTFYVAPFASYQDIGWMEEEEELFGNLRITKVSGNSDVTAGNSRYSLQGAVFNLSNAPGTPAYSANATTNAAGVAEWSNIPEGTYILTETSASKGFSLMSPSSTTIVVSGGEWGYTTVSEPPRLGAVEVTKVPKNECMVYQNPNYSLAGAIYTLTLLNDAGNKTSKVYTMPTTDRNGKTYLGNLPLGTYLLEETTVPKGYLKADNQRVTVN